MTFYYRKKNTHEPIYSLNETTICFGTELLPVVPIDVLLINKIPFHERFYERNSTFDCIFESNEKKIHLYIVMNHKETETMWYERHRLQNGYNWRFYQENKEKVIYEEDEDYIDFLKKMYESYPDELQPHETDGKYELDLNLKIFVKKLECIEEDPFIKYSNEDGYINLTSKELHDILKKALID